MFPTTACDDVERPPHVIEFTDLTNGKVNVNGFSYVPKSVICDLVSLRVDVACHVLSPR